MRMSVSEGMVRDQASWCGGYVKACSGPKGMRAGIWGAP